MGGGGAVRDYRRRCGICPISATSTGPSLSGEESQACGRRIYICLSSESNAFCLTPLTLEHKCADLHRPFSNLRQKQLIAFSQRMKSEVFFSVPPLPSLSFTPLAGDAHWRQFLARPHSTEASSCSRTKAQTALLRVLSIVHSTAVHPVHDGPSTRQLGGRAGGLL